jgi:soluble lytic murein transglycosylase-like protein
MGTKKLLTAALVTAGLLLSLEAQAAMYAYMDAKGVYHYSNVPSDSRYRVMYSDKPKSRGTAIINGRSMEDLLADDTAPSRLQLGRTSSTINRYIQQAARHHQVDPHLIRAVIKVESNFNSRAISSKGARGLMQLMPKTAQDLRVANSFDPRQNIYGGTKYLRILLDSYDGDITRSLAAYNAGPGRVKRGGSLPRIPETRAYVTKVLRYYRAYKRGAEVPVTSISLRKLVTVN